MSSASTVLLLPPEAKQGQGNTAVVSAMLYKQEWRRERDGSEVNFTFSEIPERILLVLLTLRPRVGLCLEVVCAVREESGVVEAEVEGLLM